ncbi:MAG: hypothetical protein R3321_08010 [Nitrososphaeraceae archaeon]|nr:hypothetical protein [Nitrososphaeraceae archaeon]
MSTSFEISFYLSFREPLIENSLIEYIEGTKTYRTTEKGINFLKMNNEIGELLQITTIKTNS